MENLNMKNSSLRYDIDRVIEEKIIPSLNSDKYGNRVNLFIMFNEISRILNRGTFGNLLEGYIQDKFKNICDDGGIG